MDVFSVRVGGKGGRKSELKEKEREEEKNEKGSERTRWGGESSQPVENKLKFYLIPLISLKVYCGTINIIYRDTSCSCSLILARQRLAPLPPIDAVHGSLDIRRPLTSASYLLMIRRVWCC